MYLSGLATAYVKLGKAGITDNIGVASTASLGLRYSNVTVLEHAGQVYGIGNTTLTYVTPLPRCSTYSAYRAFDGTYDSYLPPPG